MPNILTFAKSSRTAKTLLLVLAASLFAVFLTVAGNAQAARADGTASISGTVQGAGTPNVALASATVELYLVASPSSFPQYLVSTMTDANGAYSFSDLAPGNYTADFQAPDGSIYIDQWWNNKTQIFNADTFAVADGQAVTGIDPVLAAGGVITGTVEGQGSPDVALFGASVNATGSDGSFHSGAVGTDGSYSLSGLAAGRYTIQFNPPFFGNTNYVTQWWNNQPTQATANAVTVAAGQTVTGISAVLAPGASISGTVRGTDAVGVAGVSVIALLSDGTVAKVGTTDGDGNYTITSLAPGSYTLDFHAYGSPYLEQWWNGQSSLATADYFSVAAGAAVTGKDADLAAGGTISGTVLAGSPAEPLANVSVSVMGKSDPSLSGYATTDASGHYTVAGLANGTYVVLFSPPIGQSYASGWWQDASTFETATPVTIDSAAAVTDIDATLSAGASISGRVLAPGTSNTGLAGTTVEAFGSNHEPDGYAITDTNGNYTISGLSADTYSIQFVPQGDQNIAREWWGGSFILTGAKTLVVTAGESVAGIDQRLIGGATVTGSVQLQGTPSSGTPFDVVFFASDQPIGEGDQPPIEASTDASGNYSQIGLAPGKYTVEFVSEAEGWLRQWWKNKNSQTAATRLTIKAGQTKTDISAVLAPANVIAKTPRITGKTKVGSTLTAVAGNWKPSSTSLSYQWTRDGHDIDAATSSTYTLGNQDVGGVIAVRVTGTLEEYNPATATSAPTKIVTGGILTPAVPQISGSPVRGQTLTATPGTWAPVTVSLTYRWNRNGSKIGGATSSTYVLAKADVGKTITVTVTGSEANYTSLASTSAATGVVH